MFAVCTVFAFGNKFDLIWFDLITYLLTSRGQAIGYLQDHFDGENAREDVVEIVEDEVAERVFEDGIFGGQRDAAGADDDHYKQVEVAKIDDKMTEPTHAAQHSRPNYPHCVS